MNSLAKLGRQHTLSALDHQLHLRQLLRQLLFNLEDSNVSNPSGQKGI